MKVFKRSTISLLLIILTLNANSQENDRSAIIYGSIVVNKDSIYPLKPYSIIVQKDRPITFRQYEQQRIDTTDFSFKIQMELDQLTYGFIMINFSPNLDTSAMSTTGYWTPRALPDDFQLEAEDGSIRGYASRILFGGVRCVIEPGDSLHMLINYDMVDHWRRPKVHFSGPGGAKNNYLRSKYPTNWDSKNFKLPVEEGLVQEDLLMVSKLEELTLAKDSISEAYFNLVKTDIEFDNLRMKHALIRASLYGPETKAEYKRARARELYSYLDTLTLRAEHLISREFRSFLNFYLEYVNRIITGEDIAYSYDEKNYYLAKAIYRKDVLKTFLYQKLNSEMENTDFYSTKIYQYEEFISQFPNTPESLRLTRIHKKRFPVSNGQPAPDLELIDSLGRSSQLSDLKGKVLLITNYLRRSNNTVEIQDKMLALNEKFVGTELVVVSLVSPHRRSGTTFSPLVDYYVKREDSNENLSSYLFLPHSAYTFIVGKNGIINDCVSSLNIADETISELSLEQYTLLTRLNDYIQDHSRQFIVVLSFLLLLSIVFVLSIQLKQRRQSLIRKQLNSELKAIRSQLNPHFLFNSLNSIQNFINKSDKETANSHLSKFSMLMRKVIEMSEKESTSLKEELDFNKTFIELEQLRYGFKCNFDIDERIDLYNTEIPSMIIQPFIENAIVHCMSELGAEGELRIIVKEVSPEKIMVEIVDNGKGFELGTEKGFGLKSSRERIDLLNSQSKEKIKLQIESGTSTRFARGSTVRLIIPKKY